jgi:hypothetical protein
METNRKRDVSAALVRPRASAIENPLGDLAHRFWSGRWPSDGLAETTWATPVPLESGYGRVGVAPHVPKALCGELEVDRTERRATLAGSDLRLTEREYALLLFLVERANRVVRRSDLLAAIWTLPDDYGSNVVDVYIRRLRQKFGAHSGMIRTIRGFGYCLRHARAA